MILYVENPNDSTKNLLELINEFSSWRTQNQHTKISCFHTLTNEQSEKEENNSIYIAKIEQTSQLNLQTQCNTYQSSNDISCRN